MRAIVRFRALLVVACLACLALLAACGSGGSAADGTPTHTPVFTSNGCPSQVIPVDPPLHPPDVVLTQQSDPGSNIKTVSVTLGQSIEIRLPSSFTWRLSQGTPDPVLALRNPAGWYNSALRACIWRFGAASAGSVELDFAGAIVCEPGKACPALAAVARYHITVA